MRDPFVWCEALRIALVNLCKSQLVVLFQNFIYLFIYYVFIFLLFVWFCVFLDGLFSMIVKLPNQKRPQRTLVICIFISESTVNVLELAVSQLIPKSCWHKWIVLGVVQYNPWQNKTAVLHLYSQRLVNFPPLDYVGTLKHLQLNY